MTSSISYHFTASDNEINDYLVGSTSATGSRPDVLDALGTNAALMTVAGLRKAGGATDADALIAAMEGLRFAGPKGTIEIRPEDHIAIQDMYVVMLTSTTDPEHRYYEMVTTVRPQPPCLIGDDLVDRCGELPVGALAG